MAGNVSAYRVVGIRADGSQHLLSARLSLEDAQYVLRALLSAGVFDKVIVQPDESDDRSARLLSPGTAAAIVDPAQTEPSDQGKTG